MTVASAATPALPLASTYEEAACPPVAAAGDEPVVEEPGRACSEPIVVAVAPAIIDCNDPGMSPWVEEMIGSCDMPRPAPPTQAIPTVVRWPRGSPASRVCDGLHCSHDSAPLHSAPRPDENGAPMLVSSLTFGFRPSVSKLYPVTSDLRDQAHRAPPERPPRG